MLVLSRKPNERIVIGENIEITVVAVRGGRVKLGFNCPPEVSIRRTDSKSTPQERTFEVELPELVGTASGD